MPTWNPSCLKHHTALPPRKTVPTALLLSCPALLYRSLEKLYIHLLSTLFPSTQCKYNDSGDFVLFTAVLGRQHLEQCVILFAECMNECHRHLPAMLFCWNFPGKVEERMKSHPMKQDFTQSLTGHLYSDVTPLLSHPVSTNVPQLAQQSRRYLPSKQNPESLHTLPPPP